MRLRIVKYDYGFRIQEQVTKCGLYIEWQELFNSKESALKYIKGVSK